MKKEVYGQCHICGKYGKLSFEHIPPQAALNNGQVKAYSGEEILKTFHGEKATYQNMQRGMGRFSLCEKCNNTTGQWYAAIYCQVAREVASSLRKTDELEHGDVVEYRFKGLPALAFVKQIIAMFCSLLPWEEVQRLGFDQLLMDKENRSVDKKLFDLRMYLTSLETAQLLTAPTIVLYLSDDKIECSSVTDLCAYPFGFILNLSPEIPVEYGTSLMEWFDCEFDKAYHITLPLMYLERTSKKLPLPLQYQPLPKAERIIEDEHDAEK